MISAFINYERESKGASPCTLAAYRSDLREFAQWAKAQDPAITWSSVTKGFIEAFRFELQSQKCAASTVRRKVSAIRSFFRFLQSQMGACENPARYVQTPKSARMLPTVVGRDDVLKAVAHCDAATAALVVLMFSTGLRLSEALAVSVADVDKAERSIIVLGKGNKQRKVFYTALTARYLNAFAARKRGRIFDGLQPREVRRQVGEAFAAVGRHVSPHTLRHSFATAMLANGCDLFTLSHLLGHAELQTTRIYTHVALSQERCSYDRCNPFAVC